MSKKILSMFLVVLMMLSVVATSGFAENTNITFTDVDASTEEGIAIYRLVEKGIVNGNGDGTFTPANAVTRAELCKMVNNIWNLTEPAEEGFSDVTKEDWYYTHVLIGKKAGYIKGFDDGTFRGDDPVTREQACAIVSRISGLQDDAFQGVIADEISDWAVSDVKKVLVANLMTLENGNIFRATENMKRGELAKVLANTLTEESGEASKDNENAPATPVASVAAGAYKSAQKVTLTTATNGADIYYTTDGSTPTIKSAKYTKEITIAKTSTLMAIAVKNGVVSNGVMRVDYTIENVAGGAGGGAGGGGVGGGTSTPNYAEQNATVVANLTTAKNALVNNYEVFTDPEKEIIDIMVEVIGKVIADKNSYLITTTSVQGKYETRIGDAVEIYVMFGSEERGAFVSKVSQLNSTAFNFLKDFFGVDPSDF